MNRRSFLFASASGASCIVSFSFLERLIAKVFAVLSGMHKKDVFAGSYVSTRSGKEYFYDEDGTIRKLVRYVPAISNRPGGTLTYLYNEKGELHCDGNPAIFGLGFEMWYRNGRLHNFKGPAILAWVDNSSDRYYIDGTAHTAAEFSEITGYRKIA